MLKDLCVYSLNKRLTDCNDERALVKEIVVMKKRGWVGVSIDILESAITPENKTRLMCKSNLNFVLFNAYFYDFLWKGLLEETVANENGIVYVTSERGKTLLAALKDAERIFSEVPAQPLLSALAK
jgi:predicted transcriptional regulator